MLCIKAANVGVADQVCRVFVDVVHGGCVVSSSSVSCLIVDGAKFCVGASVHSVCVCANLLMFFQLARSSDGGCGGVVGLWRGGGSGWAGGGLCDGPVVFSEGFEGSLPVVLALLESPSVV